MNIDNTKLKIIIAALAGILLLLFIIIFIFNNRPPVPEPETDPDVIKNEIKQVIEITEVPRLVEEKGGGIDTSSPEVKLSQEAVAKLQGDLPYYTSFTTADGIEVEVSIPPVETVSNDWTLLVHIFGPDYQIPENSPEYDAMKNAFLAGVSEVMLFLETNDIDPSQIIIQWGDRAVIGERSQQWLNE